MENLKVFVQEYLIIGDNYQNNWLGDKIIVSGKGKVVEELEIAVLTSLAEPVDSKLYMYLSTNRNLNRGRHKQFTG